MAPSATASPSVTPVAASKSASKSASTPAASHRFDPSFTTNVINAIGPGVAPRHRFVLSSLIKHIHDFARETELTVEEWTLGTQFLNSIGQASTPTRNEGHRISDVLGLESLVDEISHATMGDSDEIPTSSSILGPFWSPHAPFRELGGSIIQDGVPPNGQPTLMHGVVTSVETKRPLAGAVVDIWQASANGKYDFQDSENQTDNNLRGKFTTDEKGEYWFYCLKPTAYSLPTDGPAGRLLELMERHPMRPAHIHLMISHPDHRPVTTQIFPKDDPYLTTDTVFAVKDDLVVDFTPLAGDKVAKLEMVFNAFLPPKSGDNGRTEGRL